ncbi:MAG TPA: hypothetical protein VM122_10595 [Usitatibacter sp.]|nr:hypothetical protein [Usitatibacter sp.]
MNKRFWISVVAVFVASMLLGMVVHGILLEDDYLRLVSSGLFRKPEDAQKMFPWMLIAHLLFAVAFTWIYRAGRDTRPWLGQGVRFGIAVAILAPVSTYLIYWAVQPMPALTVLKQCVFDTLSMVILGIVVAAVNRDPLPARA